jgi:hypothetical protein
VLAKPKLLGYNVWQFKKRKENKMKKVSTRALKDAASVCGGLYSLNARGARFYAFNCDEKEVTEGEFCCEFEVESMKSRYAFCIDRELAGSSLSSFRKALRLTSDIEG